MKTKKQIQQEIEKLIKTIIKESPYDEKCTEEIVRIVLRILNKRNKK